MDPAGPLFKKWPKEVRLDAGDAEFVDVIHTDAGIFGFPRSVGHADFWPNQGVSPQPGCTLSEVKSRAPDAIIEPSTNICSIFSIRIFKQFYLFFMQFSAAIGDRINSLLNQLTTKMHSWLLGVLHGMVSQTGNAVRKLDKNQEWACMSTISKYYNNLETLFVRIRYNKLLKCTAGCVLYCSLNSSRRIILVLAEKNCNR